MPTFIDLTIPLADSMPVYPGDEPPHLVQVKDIARDGHTNFRLSTTMHAGTHIDGPMHLTQDNRFLSDTPLNRFVGRGCLLNATDTKNNILRTKEYESRVQPQSIVLLHTGMNRLFGRREYFEDFPVVSEELAQLFVERRIAMLCIDSPSPDRHPYEIHKFLLGNDILIAENLTNLDKLVSIRSFEVIALPLNIQTDSSPARIVARIPEG